MLGKSPNQDQRDSFKPVLKEICNPKHQLVVLAHAIDWKSIENNFSVFYSNTGTPSKPVRMMAGLLILKYLENLSDERVVAAWVQNPYFQYFCGEQFFQWNFPCTPSDLTHFRNRIGTEGVKFIFEHSVEINETNISKEDALLIDTTMQEKNITFPTDQELYLKVAAACRNIAEQEGLNLRQSYVRVEKVLKQDIKFGHHPKRRKKARKAKARLKTIARRLVRDVYKGLKKKGLIGEYAEILGVMGLIIEQQKGDSNKIYSLHEPEALCIAKGKVHKQYEFGNKVSIGILPKSGIVASVFSYIKNIYDGHTAEETLELARKTTNIPFKYLVADLGYKGKINTGETLLINPSSKMQTASLKKRKKKLLKKKAGIEARISHLKHQHRMLRNYLKGALGNEINATMACATYNFKIWMMNLQILLKNQLDVMHKGFSHALIIILFQCRIIIKSKNLALVSVKSVVKDQLTKPM